jgi:hypothetical protein
MSDFMKKMKEEHLSKMNFEETTAKAEGGDLNAIGDLLRLYGFLGEFYDDKEDAKQFTYWLLKAAETGNVNCMKLYANRMIDEAFGWMEKAAEAGDAEAMWDLAHKYEGSDADKARHWYQKAAQAGDAHAEIFIKLLDAGKVCPHPLSAGEKREISRRLIMYFPHVDAAKAMYAPHKDYSSAGFTEEDYEDCCINTNMLKDLSQIAREQGLLAWEKLLPNILCPFLKGAMTLLVDGVEPKITEYVLKAVIEAENLKGAWLLSRLIDMQGILQIQNGQQPCFKNFGY